MWIQKVSVIIPGPCCPDKSVASEKIEVQLVDSRNLGIPLVATLCFYFCTARTDWFTHLSVTLDVKLLLETHTFKPGWKKKRSQVPTVFDFSMSRMWKMIWSCEPQTQTAMLPYSLFTFPSANQPLFHSSSSSPDSNPDFLRCFRRPPSSKMPWSHKGPPDNPKMKRFHSHCQPTWCLKPATARPRRFDTVLFFLFLRLILGKPFS